MNAPSVGRHNEQHYNYGDGSHDFAWKHAIPLAMASRIAAASDSLTRQAKIYGSFSNCGGRQVPLSQTEVIRRAGSPTVSRVEAERSEKIGGPAIRLSL